MPVTNEPATGGVDRIILVDDSAASLLLLEDILEKRQYRVQSFARGALALDAIQRLPPDLVLLDVNMPEMNGYELCEQLKANPQLRDIPVIFISALHETVDIVKGFRAGGADYISKPFQIEEVQARVETHLKLRRALEAERDLLERTLSGAVAALLELVQATSPALVARSNSIREIVLTVARAIELKDFWQHELAAMLSLLGCIAVPEELFERAWGGQKLTPDELSIFRAHPESGARLLSNIPRLEAVAQVIRLQQTHDAGPHLPPELRQGVQLLQLAIELDQKLYCNLDIYTAVRQLHDMGRFHSGMLDALSHYRPAEAPYDLRQVPLHDISAGMILDEDIVSTSTNVLIFKAGIVFTDLWIERLGNFARNHGVQKHIRVRVPRVARDLRMRLLSRTPLSYSTESGRA
ncbi:MAG TPA: response regulator [Acidobacteriaceae bacterium]|nr:response regulator [Acidobacteriaceae bacterium]